MTPQQKYLDASARIEGPYRYRLTRSWGTGPHMVYAMLNPSTADALKDDQTIRRCCYYAAREGYAGIVVVNLYAWRATSPLDLWEAMWDRQDVVGPLNDDYTLDAFNEALTLEAPIVAAWGVNAREDRVRDVLGLLGADKRQLLCLGHTLDGHPRHPSRLPNDAPLEPWESARIELAKGWKL